MKNNDTVSYQLKEVKHRFIHPSFMWFFTILLIVFNTPLFGQEHIVREAAEAFMNSRELMVFSEEYDEVFFENIKDSILSNSAEVYLQSVIDQNLNSAIVYHNIGIAYLLSRNFPEASKNLKLALDKDACLVNANIGLAIIYSFNERLPKAIKQIEGA
ncbi:MAG: tetratricopeptide repeat protein, partial [Chitinophagales bacterium]